MREILAVYKRLQGVKQFVRAHARSVSAPESFLTAKSDVERAKTAIRAGATSFSNTEDTEHEDDQFDDEE